MTLDDLLSKWLGTEGGAERANYQMFLTELSYALGLPTPHAKGAGLGEYEFEAPVRSEAIYGGKGTKRIDLYKRNHFILEAKQSQVREGEIAPDDPLEEPHTETEFDLFGTPIRTVRKEGKPRRRYDRLMEDARLQAQRYALALPEDHATPPFLIVADIGRAFELYFDWAGNGRGYRPFPDERGYRIALADLGSDVEIAGIEKTAADTLRAIWTDPASIDPRTRAARVTRDIAQLLSRVAKTLEEDQRRGRADDETTALGIEATSLFLMRTLFCMFAEDVELLEKDSFKRFLTDAEGRSDLFWRDGLENLWRRMNSPEQHDRFWSQGDTIVRYFNGNLFAGAKVYDLAPEAKKILRIAADQDWRAVEPAIFGTLLEQVLTTSERAKLGAHYTPRPYVQRLVQATVMEVLEPEWEAVREAARAAADAGDRAAAVAQACAFHTRLADIRVLDPACGTGNFLYVAMENLLRLESEVRQFVIGLGGNLDPAVQPNQFLGLELNPRAAVIAELVLWIGWLRFRLANTPDAVTDPVLPPLSNINRGTHGGYDAVLVRDATGEPDTTRPRRPEWPEADFIVGNPPFIGGKDLRDRLGSAYAEALWKANPRVPKSADFVMQWWDRAADILTRDGTRLRRFGFVTTNSITQVFSRRVIEGWLAQPTPAGVGEERKLHLTLAIPDHPWTRVGDGAAAVRIAMTVAEAGAGDGKLVEIVSERGLDTDDPELDERDEHGRVNADLSVGTDVTQVVALKANEGLSIRGIELHGDGYVAEDAAIRAMMPNQHFYERYVRKYVHSREFKGKKANLAVLDLFDLTERQLRQNAPLAYEHLLKTAFESRKHNSVRYRRDNWWKLALPHTEIREGLRDISRYIATIVTSSHRWFAFVPAGSLPDQGLMAVMIEDDAVLGVLSSRIHTDWSAHRATLEDRPRYNNTVIFDPFPFPSLDNDKQPKIAELADELEETRRKALAENPKLTMTGLYNLVVPIREGTLPAEQETAATRARAYIVAKLHGDLDQAVADAYGWGEEWRRAPLPPAEIVRRLVALNAERAAEEAAGHVRWLRPDYQIPRFAGKA